MPEARFASGAIPSRVLEKFRSLLLLPDEKLKAINQWAKTHLQVLVDSQFEGFEVRSAAGEIGVHESELALAASLIASLLFSADVLGSIDIADLKEIGLGDLEEKGRLLLDGIMLPARELEYARQKGLAAQSVVATLEGAEALCDLRAVFGRLPSPSRSETHVRNVRTLLGFEPVVLVSLGLNDSVGNDTSTNFQITERPLRDLIKTLQEALAQLEIVKETKQSLGLPKEVS